VTDRKDFALDSGERINIVDEGLVHPDHLARYQFVVDDLAAVRRTLFGADVFCGTGYGANMLARAIAGTVLAIDGSVESIAQATTAYRRANLFFAAKLFPFELPRSAFDFVTSMESIEHVRDYRAFAAVLHASLRPGGRLYLSAPDEQKVVLARTGYPWHYQHFAAPELDELFGGLGMRKLRAATTNATVNDDGNVICPYAYATYGEALLPPGVGDTHLMVYERP
jgi:SAM-dependent methyltransferase